MIVRIYGVMSPDDGATVAALGTDQIGVVVGEHGAVRDEVNFETANRIFDAIKARATNAVAVRTASDPPPVSYESPASLDSAACGTPSAWTHTEDRKSAECLQPSLFTRGGTSSPGRGSSSLRGLGLDANDTDRLWIEQITKAHDHWSAQPS